MDTQEGKILSFSVTNYSSFKHKTTIDFEFKKNSQNTKNKIRYIKQSGKKLLPVIGIYGKNASGFKI